MAFFGDYHTHTVHSHGKGSITQNVERAREIGLKEVAITDHGFRHMVYNVPRREWAQMRAETDKLNELYPDIKVYLGLETNLSSRFGTADLRERDKELLDITVCGYHKLVVPHKVSDIFRFFLPNLIKGEDGKYTKKQIVRNTDAYLKLLENYEIDIVSHINYGIKADAVEVARACKHFGTYVELNGKRISMTDEELSIMASEGVEFVCNSDAHSVDRVGDMSLPLETVKRVGIDLSQIANWERLPSFRSRKNKEK